jgi:hypothetical protein
MPIVYTAPGGGAPTNAQYVTVAANAELTDERILTGTANRVTVSDGGAGGNVTLDIGTDVTTNAGVQTLTSKTVALGSNTITGTTAEFNAANTDADFYTTGGADVAIEDGGTAASTVAGAKTNLNIIPTDVCFLARPGFTWLNQPQAATEAFGTARETRKKIDLTNANEIRIVAGVMTASTSANTPRIYFNYATSDIAPNTTLTSNSISLATAATTATAWESIPSGAKADVWVSLFGAGGDGAADPVITEVALQVR